ncbi:hypothetical protein ACFQPG_11310 [Sphingomonas sp. GCM10030256]|uniref:hypothetical protein n=1 Tax=Sphingomonas sp. GCM10030256 TaxID=3273427 RepID=UPI00360C37A3
MTFKLLAAAGAALLLAVPAIAAPPVPPVRPAPATEKTVIQVREVQQTVGTDAVPADIRTAVANCEGRKFVADASSGAGKDLRRTRIVLCGKKGASDAEVATMLKSAIAKIEANPQLPAENKGKVVAQLKAKLAELKAE